MFLNIYEFTEADLKSNQRGFITTGQKAWLQSMAGGIVRVSRRTIPIGLGFTVFGLCLVIALYIQNDETRKALFSGLNAPTALIGIVGSIFAVAGILALGILFSKRQANRLLNAELITVQGAVSFQEEYSTNSAIISYHLLIGHSKIAFGDNPRDRFEQGVPYRVHYVKAGAYELVLSYNKMNL